MCTDSTAQDENSEEGNVDGEREGILLELLRCHGAADSVSFQVFRDTDNGLEMCPKWSDSGIVAPVISEPSSEPSSATSGNTDKDKNDREETERYECLSAAEAAQALEVIQQFAVRGDSLKSFTVRSVQGRLGINRK